MYRVQVGPFEGPLDLLLFFVKRDEINIYDIPIARITEEFLAYVQLMKALNLDGVGDFLYFAALLMDIKARTLLPSEEGKEQEEDDPRRELVERLLEYVRFKEAAGQLEELHRMRQLRYTRGYSPEAERYQEVEETWEAPSLGSLIRAFQAVMKRASHMLPVHQVEMETYTLEEQREQVLKYLRGAGKVPFSQLVARRSRAFVIVTFLAILELLKNQMIRVFPGTEEDFYLELCS